MNLTAAFNILTGIGLGIVFTLLAGRVARERREDREIEERYWADRWRR
jgi:hypothetical protein